MDTRVLEGAFGRPGKALSPDTKVLQGTFSLDIVYAHLKVTRDDLGNRIMDPTRARINRKCSTYMTKQSRFARDSILTSNYDSTRSEQKKQ